MTEEKRLTLSDAHDWAEFRVGDLFKVTGSKTTAKSDLESIGGSKYPYITTQATNNSVAGFYDYATEKGNCIIAESAVAGFVSYQAKDFSASAHVEKLIPYYKEFNQYHGMFIVTVIRYVNTGKYNYGHKFNQQRIRETMISLPVTRDGKPDYNFMENYIKQLYDDFADRVCVYTEPVEKNTDISLSDREWKEFQLKSLFTKVSRGKRLTKANRIAGNTPMVTAGFLNYGVGEYISNPEQQRFSDAITIDMFCNAFYRGSEFCCDDNIIVLQNDKITKYQKIFITAIINERKALYSYGNQYRLGDLETHIVSLPVTPEGQPDYDFMEQYIKSLPFSKALEI